MAYILKLSSKRAQALHALKVGIRGSIRKAPSITDWVQTLAKLRACGDTDIAAIIRAHNQAVPKSAQLLAGKATAVKNLLDSTPPEVLHCILEHVNRYGWQGSCFSDEALSSRKILPGYVFRGGSGQKWLARGKTSKESMSLMVRALTHAWDNANPETRRKLYKSEVEEKAEQAAFVIQMALETQTTEVGVTDQDLEQAWIIPFAENDAALVLEVTCQLSSKNPDLHPRHVKQIRAV